MSLLKRAELWVLLAIAIAGIIFALRSKQRDDARDVGEPGGVAVSSDDAPLKLHRCVIERDYGNARLDIELRVRNSGAEKLVLQSPGARLLSAKGREIPGFFLSFEQLPEVPGQTAQDVQLRYWLEAADLQGALKLEVDGRTIDVKSAKPFDLNTLKNAEKITFNAGQW